MLTNNPKEEEHPEAGSAPAQLSDCSDSKDTEQNRRKYDCITDEDRLKLILLIKNF